MDEKKIHTHTKTTISSEEKLADDVYQLFEKQADGSTMQEVTLIDILECILSRFLFFLNIRQDSF